MWENLCKVAVGGVGYSKITCSAEIPLAEHPQQPARLLPRAFSDNMRL